MRCAGGQVGETLKGRGEPEEGRAWIFKHGGDMMAETKGDKVGGKLEGLVAEKEGR